MTTYYLTSDYGKLSRYKSSLNFEEGKGAVKTIYPHRVGNLVIIGHIEVTNSALKLLMRHGIDTVFLTKNGKYNGKIVFNESKNVFLRKKQFADYENMGKRLLIVKDIIRGKINNQIIFMQRILRNNRIEELEKVIIESRALINSIDYTENINSLRGYEGAAGRNFFSVFRHNIKPKWAKFNGRSTRPPKDEVNAVLSFLYTLIFYRVDAALIAEGLDTYVGYQHALEYGRRSLSLDIMEQFRTPLADRLTCSLFNKGTLTPEDFRTELTAYGETTFEDEDEIDKSEATLLTSEGIKKVIKSFEKSLEKEIYFSYTDKKTSFKSIIKMQAAHIKRIVLDEELNYSPLVLVK